MMDYGEPWKISLYQMPDEVMLSDRSANAILIFNKKEDQRLAEQLERAKDCVNALSPYSPDALAGLVKAVEKFSKWKWTPGPEHERYNDYERDFNSIKDALAAFKKGE